VNRAQRIAALSLAAVLIVGAAAGVLVLRASTARLHHACEVGRQLIYRIVYVSDDAASPGAVFGSQQGKATLQQYHMRLTGALAVTTSACDPGGTTQLWNVVAPDIELSSAIAPTLFEAMLHRDLSRPYVVRTDGTGRVVKLAHDPAAGTLGTTLMRRIVAEMEVVAPRAPALTAQAWQVEEPDVAGTRTSTYHLQPWIANRLGTATLEFHRTSGVDVRPRDDGRVVRHPTIQGVAVDQGRWRLDGSLDWLDTSYTERTTIGGNLVARSQIAFEAQRIAAPRLHPERLAAIDTYGSRALASSDAAPLHVTESERAVDQRGFSATLGADSAATLARALAAAPPGADARARAPLADKLAALFYLQPKTIAAFMPTALGAAPDSTAFRVIVQSLERADSAPAQRALLALLDARAADGAAGPAVAAGIGLLAQPISAVDAVLARAAAGGTRVTAQTAELALGSVASAVAVADPGRAERLVAHIRGRLAAARSAEDVQLELLALGNAGDPATLQTIERYARDANADVRAGAAVALRHQPASEADETLGRLLGDRESVVRLSAASAFVARNPSHAAYLQLQGSARGDSNATVRASAVEAVWKARAAYPDAPAFVREVAATDTDSGVRNTARSALASIDRDEDLAAPIDVLLGQQ
jgi:hypothetical protein